MRKSSPARCNHPYLKRGRNRPGEGEEEGKGNEREEEEKERQKELGPGKVALLPLTKPSLLVAKRQSPSSSRGPEHQLMISDLQDCFYHEG